MNESPPIMFPIKGVNRTFGRSAQPPGTSYDMLNVMPFDASGRIRGGTRPGTEKLIASAIGSGAPVVLIAQVTTIVDPKAEVIDTNELLSSYGLTSGALVAGTVGAWQSNGPILLIGGGTSIGDGYEFQSDGSIGLVAGAETQDIFRETLTVPAQTYYVEGYFKVVSRGTGGTGLDSVGWGITLFSTGASSVSFQLQWFAGATDAIMIWQFPDGTNASSTTPLNVGQPYHWGISASGGTLSFLLDGSVVASASSSESVTDMPLFSLSRTLSDADIRLINYLQQSTGVKSSRVNILIAVSDGDTYAGDTASLPIATGGASTLDAAVIPQMAYSLGKAYLVDGTSIVQMDLVTKTIEAYTASAGAAPPGCTLAAMYRDRLVLAAPYASPENFYFSRVGDQHDWDYGQSDPAAAFAGNASVAGHIGEPIVSLMPLSDDLLLIGGDHNLWMVRGDPADGGSIDMISDAIGVLSANGWTKSPDGTVYFLGTGGLYRMASGGGQPELLSQNTWNEFFRTLNRAANRINLAWDRDRHGCFIFITPIDTTLDAGTHLWYDARTEGLFPLKFPKVHGPFSATVIDGDGPDDRVLLMGGGDGYIREFSPSVLNDDGTAIDSYVYLGPLQIGDNTHDGIVENVIVTYGDSAPTNSFNATVTVKTGRDAYSVTDGTTPHMFTRSFSGQSGRVPSIARRLRGAWCSVKIENTTINKLWSMESVIIKTSPAGITRR